MGLINKFHHLKITYTFHLITHIKRTLLLLTTHHFGVTDRIFVATTILILMPAFLQTTLLRHKLLNLLQLVNQVVASGMLLEGQVLHLFILLRALVGLIIRSHFYTR